LIEFAKNLFASDIEKLDWFQQTVKFRPSTSDVATAIALLYPVFDPPQRCFVMGTVEFDPQLL